MKVGSAWRMSMAEIIIVSEYYLLGKKEEKKTLFQLPSQLKLLFHWNMLFYGFYPVVLNNKNIVSQWSLRIFSIKIWKLNHIWGIIKFELMISSCHLSFGGSGFGFGETFIRNLVEKARKNRWWEAFGMRDVVVPGRFPCLTYPPLYSERHSIILDEKCFPSKFVFDVRWVFFSF